MEPYVNISRNRQDDVSTPLELYNAICRTFDVTHDPCPLNGLENGRDAMTEEWGEVNFVNPPFSNIKAFVERTLAVGKPTYMLVPVRTNTHYWRDYVYDNVTAIYFFVDKIKFTGYNRPCPLPMCLLVFNTNYAPPITELGGLSIVKLVVQ